MNLNEETLPEKSKNDLHLMRRPLKDVHNLSRTPLRPTSYFENTWIVIVCYHVVFWSGGIYSIYNFYTLSQKWRGKIMLTEKSSVYGSYQDQNDLEWRIFMPLIIECAPYGFIHLILAQITKCYYPLHLRLFHAVFGTLMLVKIVGVFATALCYIIPSVMFMVLFTHRKSLIWLTWCCILIAFNCKLFQDFLEKFMNDGGEGEYKTSVTLAWVMLRCVSFCLITCDKEKLHVGASLPLLINILAYSFYFPHLITGPYLSYADYVQGVNKPFEAWTKKKFLWFIGQFLRFMFWLWLADLSLYHFYAHSLIYSPSYIERFSSWTMAGYYSFLLTFFLLKYVVMYGLPSVLSRAEGFSPPDPPRCVLLIQRYSDVWKYFDIGLYRFMVDHIYVPFLGEGSTLWRQMQGSVVAFTFIYVWHGAYPSVFWWCLFNFVLTVAEKIADGLKTTPFYRKWENKLLPGFAGKIFRLFASGFFLSLSMNSLIIFLTSFEHAQHVFMNIYIKGFPVTTFTTTFFFALMSQGGSDLQAYRSKRKKNI